jgi:hypothetical protein
MADIHLGVKLPNEDYLKSLDMFLGLIKKHREPCHGIFVLGDLFEHRLSIEETRFASLFIVNLVCNQCGENNTNVPVYFIHGTYGHDIDQYEMFLPMLNKIQGTKVYYFKNVCSIVTEEGTRVLCIPHENGNIDYTPYFNEKYDMICGHGVIVSNTKNPCKTELGIIHSADKLGSISKLCVFGHFHGYTDFGNNVYYIGPWTRWKYGEDEKRVFFFCDDDFNIETVPNPFAMEFKTVEINTPDELREIISQKIETPYRFIINSNSSDMDAYRGIILSTRQNQNIKYKLSEIIDEDKIVDKSEYEPEQTDNVSRPIPSLIEYIKQNYNVDVSDKLTEYENQIRKDNVE